jgi:two-component system, chemotaxis family, CheB/CheR fusion protein
MPESAAPPKPDAFPIVGIAASAGGLEAFMQLLQALPDHTGMAFVLVQHLDPLHDSRLPDLLAKAIRMPVLEAAQCLAVQPDHVYVIAPDTTLTLTADGSFHIEPRGHRPGPHLPIDQFFRSLATNRASGAIGVVLSGTGSDGSMGLRDQGCRWHRFCAGRGLGQVRRDATGRAAYGEYRSGIAARAHRGRAGGYRPASLPRTCTGGRAHPCPSRGQLRRRLQVGVALLRQASGVDFGAYRDTTIKRRITRRLMLHGGDSLDASRSGCKATAPSSTRCTRTS